MTCVAGNCTRHEKTNHQTHHTSVREWILVFRVFQGAHNVWKQHAQGLCRMRFRAKKVIESEGSGGGEKEVS